MSGGRGLEGYRKKKDSNQGGKIRAFTCGNFRGRVEGEKRGHSVFQGNSKTRNPSTAQERARKGGREKRSNCVVKESRAEKNSQVT